MEVDLNNSVSLDVDEQEGEEISPLLRILIAVITIIPVFVNIFYIVVCFKTLKKKFHNLLVLMLCIGDSMLSLSITMFSLSKFSESMAKNVPLCIFQTFTVSYGVVFTYNIVFLICCERYYVVKNLNYGVQSFFERFKLVIIGGTSALGFMLTIETVLFVEHEHTIESCTVPNLYGKQLRLFIVFIGIGVTILFTGIIVYSFFTSLMIWYLFFKATYVEPVHKLNHVDIRNKEFSTESFSDIQSTSYAPQSNNTESKRNKVYLTDSLSEQHRKSCVSQTHPFEVIEQHKNTVQVEIYLSNSKGIKQLLENMKKNRIGSIISSNEGTPTAEKKVTRFKPDAWETRAFITSIIIAASTIFLTAPYIVSFWLDFFYGDRFTSRKTKLYLSVPLVVNSIINPFIYAWRIPEIKQEIKKIFKRG